MKRKFAGTIAGEFFMCVRNAVAALSDAVVLPFSSQGSMRGMKSLVLSDCILFEITDQHLNSSIGYEPFKTMTTTTHYQPPFAVDYVLYGIHHFLGRCRNTDIFRYSSKAFVEALTRKVGIVNVAQSQRTHITLDTRK